MVNHLGPFLFTNLLIDTIKATGTAEDPARIINVSSMGHRLTTGLNANDLFHGNRRDVGLRAYCDSKLANVLFTIELARRREDSNVVVHALHPRAVRTGLGRNGSWRTPPSMRLTAPTRVLRWLPRASQRTYLS